MIYLNFVKMKSILISNYVDNVGDYVIWKFKYIEDKFFIKDFCMLCFKIDCGISED